MADNWCDMFFFFFKSSLYVIFGSKFYVLGTVRGESYWIIHFNKKVKDTFKENILEYVRGLAASWNNIFWEKGKKRSRTRKGGFGLIRIREG